MTKKDVNTAVENVLNDVIIENEDVVTGPLFNYYCIVGGVYPDNEELQNKVEEIVGFRMSNWKEEEDSDQASLYRDVVAKCKSNKLDDIINAYVAECRRNGYDLDDYVEVAALIALERGIDVRIEDIEDRLM